MPSFVQPIDDAISSLHRAHCNLQRVRGRRKTFMAAINWSDMTDEDRLNQTALDEHIEFQLHCLESDLSDYQRNESFWQEDSLPPLNN